MSDAKSRTDDPAFAAKLERFRDLQSARGAEIKAALAKWIEPRDTVADAVCSTRALFELALDHHVALHGADAGQSREFVVRGDNLVQKPVCRERSLIVHDRHHASPLGLAGGGDRLFGGCGHY
jgi:hypothetical protein